MYKDIEGVWRAAPGENWRGKREETGVFQTLEFEIALGVDICRSALERPNFSFEDGRLGKMS